MSTLAAYVALALTWGSSFAFMKVALDAFAPTQVALGRILIGATTLTTLMALTRRPWARERWLWRHMTIVAVLLCVIPFLLFAWAGTFLPSGLSAILNSTTPIWTAIVMALANRQVRLTAGQLLGVAVGVAGVAMVMGIWQMATDPAFRTSLPAQAACLATTASYGIAFVWMHRFVTGRHGHDAVTVAAVQLAAAAAVAALLAPFVARAPIEAAALPALNLLALGVLGTGIAYVWNTRVVVDWGPLAAATVTYLTPLVGVLIGVALLGERLRWHAPIGAIMVIVSVMLVQRRLGRHRSRA